MAWKSLHRPYHVHLYVCCDQSLWGIAACKETGREMCWGEAVGIHMKLSPQESWPRDP